MHNAPAVSYPVVRSRFQALMLVLLSVTASLVWLLWAVQAPVFNFHHALTAVWMALMYPWVWWQWAQSKTGQLSWSGEPWRWETTAGSEVVSPVPVIDAQVAVLLQLQRPNVTAKEWLWVEQQTQPARWFALRRALMQRHIRAKMPFSDTPDASPSHLERVA